MANRSSTKTAIERIEDAIREIATLLIALAPLDAVLAADRSQAVIYGLIFEAIGVSLFALALFLERKRLGA